MPILYAELQIAGRQVACDQVSFSFTQTTDDQGRPSSVVRTGLLRVLISGAAAGWSIWEEIKFDSYRRESGHVVFFKNEGITAKRYTFWDAALVSLKFRYDGKGTAGRQTATQVELHFSAATIELDGIRLENYSLIPWKTDANTSFRALTPPPLPSAHLTAGAGLLATAKLKAEQASTGLIKKVLTPAGELGTEIGGISTGAIARTAGLLPILLLTPMNENADPAQDGDWQMYKRNNTHPPIPPPPQSDELRLAELERALTNQTLDAQQEAELIMLLAKVKGIHIQRLADLPGPRINGRIATPIFTPLLPGEGEVGTYRELGRAGTKRDDVTAHHVPSAAYIEQHGIANNDGVCINMEQPRRGGRHRRTQTFGGNMTPAQRAAYYKLSPREVLDHDIEDVRHIFREEGKLTPEIERQIQKVRDQNLAKFPHLYR